MNANAALFWKIGLKYANTKYKASETLKCRRFKSFFGVSPSICCLIWSKVVLQAPPDARPQHLLWCLNFLKKYSVEHTRHSIFKADEKTVRKWTWIFVELLADLNEVCL